MKSEWLTKIESLKQMSATLDACVDHIDFLEANNYSLMLKVEELQEKLDKLEAAGFPLDEAIG